VTGVAALTWSLETSLPDWLEVPAHLPDPEQWRSDVALVFEALEDVDSQLTERAVADGGPLRIAESIDSLLEVSQALPDDRQLIAALTIPGRWPLPVIVAVSTTGDEPQDLLQAAGASRGSAVELPIVDYLPESLGNGIRVTRFDLDDEGGIWATVSCARRADDVDTLLTWRTADLELVPLFSPYLEKLLSNVRIGGLS
jgi:hypothetical protein